VMSATTAVIYIDLRMRKEGLDLELIRFVEARSAGEPEPPDPYLSAPRHSVPDRPPVAYPPAQAGGFPAPGVTYPGQPSAAPSPYGQPDPPPPQQPYGQPYAAQQYPGQYPTQQYPAQQYPGQYPTQQNAAQPYPAPQYPAPPQPAQPYPSQQYSGQPYPPTHPQAPAPGGDGGPPDADGRWRA